jgi:hypothetical protein
VEIAVKTNGSRDDLRRPREVILFDHMPRSYQEW